MTGVCHDIVGTDGLAFSPGVTSEDTLWLFNDQLCRSIWLKYAEDVHIDGIKALKFTPPAEVFSFSNPDNYCYCPDIKECATEVDSQTWDLKDCERCVDGIISLEGCQGVPVIMSTPHFLDGDVRLWQAIDGLQPQRDLHVTYLNLEPLSGERSIFDIELCDLVTFQVCPCKLTRRSRSVCRWLSPMTLTA